MILIDFVDAPLAIVNGYACPVHTARRLLYLYAGFHKHFNSIDGA